MGSFIEHLTLPHIDFIVVPSIPMLALLLISTYGANSFQVTSYGMEIRGTGPAKIRGKGEKLYGKEVTVIVILPDDE